MSTPVAPPETVTVAPTGPATGVGVLVLSGSSGRVDQPRARLLAAAGAVAVAVRWFGGPGQPPGICEVPLEGLVGALDRLTPEVDRVALLGTSKGAEAALLVAAHDPRVDVVVAVAPPHVVWANVGPGLDGRDRPLRSSWTLGGRPLPFVPYVDDWVPDDDPPAFVGLYTASAARFADRVVQAALPVERIAGDVLLVAGGDDRVWPSTVAVRELVRRRAAHGLGTHVLTDADAGHRVLLPGESPPQGGRRMAHGGAPEADARLGRRVRDELTLLLPLLPRTATDAQRCPGGTG